jgi:hypothetical protein
MLKKLRDKLNGNLPLVVQAIVLTGILFWMFCQVRDLPATYVTKAEYQAEQANISRSLEKMDAKVDDIHRFLMGRNK